MAAPPLPTPRVLITTLINSFPSPIDGPFHPQAGASKSPNPLRNLSPSHRSYLTTLHVLFPDILLKSLDLLDRGLVTQVRSKSQDTALPDIQPRDQDAQGTSLEAAGDADQDTRARSEVEEQTQDEQSSVTSYFYLVKSSQEPRSRFKPTTSNYDTNRKTYIVRTQSWNCSCEAFAFSAFPSSAPLNSWRGHVATNRGDGDRTGLNMDLDWREDEHENLSADRERWEFGGWARDGRQGGNVPCCKHLLACVLGEKWNGMLGGYVKEIYVGREEMAGLAAG